MAYVFRRPWLRVLRPKRPYPFTPGASVTFQLNADPGSFALTGNDATFAVSEAANVGAFSISGVSASFSISWPNAATAFAWAGVAQSFTVSEAAAVGAFTINGRPANEIILEADGPAAWTISGNPANLVRTGDDYDPTHGGIGHYKLELERAKQLARITRKPPPPVDLRTAPRFDPIGSPPIASPAPVTELAPMQNKRMADEMRAAAIAKKRREEEAILLLAS